MKTAISIPDDTFEKVTRRANDLGMSCSEFFSTAARHYLDELDAASLTHQIDEALATLSGPDDSASAAVGVASRVLARVPDEW